MYRQLMEQDGRVTQLAALLCQASRLAGLVNSDEFSDEQRDLLRELVGQQDYHELTTNLLQMSSTRAREFAARNGRLRRRVIHERR